MFKRRLLPGFVVIICLITISFKLVGLSFGLLPPQQGVNREEFASSGSHNGWAIFENTDAGTFINDNAQAVIISAPAVLPTTVPTPGPNTPVPPPAPNNDVALLNNVVTTTGYFMQNGLLMGRGAGLTVYTSPVYNLGSQPYTMVFFYKSHDYRFTITYTSNTWYLCIEDQSTVPPLYQCKADAGSSAGTSIKGDLFTSIFIEVFGSSTNWHSGYSTPFKFRNAKIYINGIAQNWQTQHKHTLHSCLPTHYPVDDAVKGTLIAGAEGRFRLIGVPPYCP